MNHEQRLEACREVSSKLLRSYPDDVVATAVFGSVARGEDREFSDIDMQVIVREDARLPSHSFILDGCYFSVSVKTKADWMRELMRPESGLCLTAGSLQNVLVLHDPYGAFGDLRDTARALPAECWKTAIRDGIAGLVEDLGRVRNFYRDGDMASFRLFSVLVAIGEAKVYGDIFRLLLSTEKDLNAVFEKHGGSEGEAARAYRTAARLVESTDQETMDALEWLNAFLTQEAKNQDALPFDHLFARNYTPP